MKVVTVGHTKGGVGKSTIACNLAIMAARDGLKVLLIDADTQQSAMAWRANRLGEDITAVSMLKPTIHKDIQSFSGFDIVIIDVGGRDGALLRSAFLASDILLIPILPSFFDIASGYQVAEILREARTYRPISACFLLNRVNPAANVTETAETSLKDFAEHGITLLSSYLANRVIYNAADNGFGVIEVPGNGKAGEELTALWMELKPLIAGEANTNG